MTGGARLRITLLGEFKATRSEPGNSGTGNSGSTGTSGSGGNFGSGGGAGRADVALPVPGARLQALIVRLALAGGRPVEPSVLVDAIWAEDPPADPAHALQALISRLRRALGSAAAVAPVPGGYRLAVEPDDVDALRFERLAVSGKDNLRTGDPTTAATSLHDAMALWGPPTAIAAVAPGIAARLTGVASEAAADLADAELARNRPDAAAARLTALLAEQPTHERAAALLMDALAVQGREAEALAVFERFRETLADALGTDPGAALRDRHLRLLRGETLPRAEAQRDESAKSEARRGGDRVSPGWEGSDDPRSIPPDARPHGERPAMTEGDQSGNAPNEHGGTRPETRAGARPETRAGARPETRGGLRPGERAGGPAGNLPASVTSFVGRDDDLARIGVLLGSARLVTVVGPGGAGKTRLALEAGRRHRHEYRDGTWLVDLSAVAEPGKVAAALLAGTGLRGASLFETGGRGRTDADLLADELAGEERLLVVDNCEHLVDAVARLVAGLLSRCPGLRVLATSREPLAIDGETLVPLGPLALPEAGDGVGEIRRTASVRLFAERAAAVRPGFAVDRETVSPVLDIVRGLDGMPLALELAAARLRTLSLTEVADGLSDRFRLLGAGGRRDAVPRHRTLRAVIAWSWDLLGADERTVADFVSILPGGITAASATAVCTGIDAGAVPDLLAALVDRSLLQLAPDTGRYRMLETIREYGRENLDDPDESRKNAARYFADLVADHDPLLRGPRQLDAFRVLRAEYGNIVAALRYFCDAGDADAAIGLAVNLTWYWQMFGSNLDAAYWLGRAVALPTARDGVERDIAEGVLLLNTIATQSILTGEAHQHLRTRMRAVTDRLLSHPDLPGFGFALAAVRLASLEETEGSPEIIQRMVDGPDVWLSGLARLFRAQFAENQGRIDQVRTDVAAALDCFGRAGDRWGLATTLPLRAMVRQYDDDLDGALADLTEATRLAREFGSLSIHDEIFVDLRWIDLNLRLGRTTRAMETVGAARERALRSASPEMAILLDVLEAGVCLRSGDLDRARALIESAESGAAADPGFGGDKGGALVGAARGRLCLAHGDGPDAAAALEKAYAAAVTSKDMPILAAVAVAAAGLPALYGRHREVAVLLGAAARLRGAHDRTDPEILLLTAAARTALGPAVFEAAYEAGWSLDGRAALTRVNPALPG